MSLQNITTGPNDINLYCKSINVDGISIDTNQSITLTFSGPWAAPQNCAVVISKVGKTVTLQFSQVSVATAGATIEATSTTSVPYLPVNPFGGVPNAMFVINLGNLEQSGIMTIESNGIIRISRNGGFQITGANAGWQPFAVTYITV
jgi:hypothetical protein